MFRNCCLKERQGRQKKCKRGRHTFSTLFLFKQLTSKRYTIYCFWLVYTAYPHNPAQTVRPGTEELDERSVRLAGHILRAPNHDPLRQVTFTYQPDSADSVRIGKGWIGRPRQNWVYRSNEDIPCKYSNVEYDGGFAQMLPFWGRRKTEQYSLKANRPSIWLLVLMALAQDAWQKTGI